MIKRIINNRGIALETAISFTIILYALCFLIFVASFREKIRDSRSNYVMDTQSSIEQVGEDFFATIVENYSSDCNGEDILDCFHLRDAFANSQKLEQKILFESKPNIENYTLVLTRKIESEDSLELVDEILLEVVVSANNLEKEIKITKWYFDNPNKDTEYIDKLQKEYSWNYES